MAQPVEERRETEAVLNSRQRLAQLAGSVGTRSAEYASELNQLALLLILQGDIEAAEPLLREALVIRREVLGPRHPDYATNLSSIGGLLWARGELEQAESLFLETVEIRCAILGPEHPKSLISINSLEQVRRARKERQGQPPPSTPPDSVFIAESPAPRPDEEHASSTVEIFETPATPLAALNAQYEAVGRDFARLATQAEYAAEALRNVGRPPDETLLDAWCATRLAFQSLASQVEILSQEACTSSVTEPFTSLAEIDAAIARLEAAAEERDARRGLVAQARLVLDRAASLRCPSDPAFAPLAACRDQIEAIHGGLDDVMSDVASRLADGTHPIACLVGFVDADEQTPDSQWADWYDAIECNLGHDLAVAAARGKFVRDRG